MLDKLLFGVSIFTDVCTCIALVLLYFAIDAHVLLLLRIRQVDTEYLATPINCFVITLDKHSPALPPLKKV